jgi:hypothetical protein
LSSLKKDSKKQVIEVYHHQSFTCKSISLPKKQILFVILTLHKKIFLIAKTLQGMDSIKGNMIVLTAIFLCCIDELEAMADLRTRPMFKKI